MYNENVLAILNTCLEHILAIEKYFTGANNSEHFFKLNNGAQYDATLMRLQALGETFKKISNKYFFVVNDLAYPEIDSLIRFRDYVSHHYEQLEHEVIFDICSIKIPELKTAVIKLIENNKSL